MVILIIGRPTYCIALKIAYHFPVSFSWPKNFSSILDEWSATSAASRSVVEGGGGEKREEIILHIAVKCHKHCFKNSIL